MAKVAYTKLLTGNRAKLLKAIARFTSKCAQGRYGADARISLTATAYAMRSSWEDVTPPTSMRTVHKNFTESLDAVSSLSEADNVLAMRQPLVRCLELLEKTGGLADSGICRAIRADLAVPPLVMSHTEAAFKSACHPVSLRDVDFGANKHKGRKLRISGKIYVVGIRRLTARDLAAWKGCPEGRRPRMLLFVDSDPEAELDIVGIVFDEPLKGISEDEYQNYYTLTVWGEAAGRAKVAHGNTDPYPYSIPMIYAKYVEFGAIY